MTFWPHTGRMVRVTVTLLVLLAGGLPTAVASSTEIAVVVSPENPIDDIPWGDLVKIFRLEQQYWSGKEKIYVLLRETGSKEKDVALQRLYETSDQGLKQLWLAKIYREEITAFPRVLNSNEAVIRFVNQVPGAIGFIDASQRDHRVKTLRVDGSLPGESSYPLRAE